MTRIVTRPSVGASMLGGSIKVPPQPCIHGPARSVSPWTGEDGTAGTVAVVGAGKMGLPLAAQFATPRLERDRGGRQPRGGRRDQRRPVPRRRGAGAGRAGGAGACGGPPPGDARRGCRGARRRRRRPDRPGHARRGAPARLPLHGPGGRLDRPGRPRRLDRHLRDHAAHRRHPQAGSRRASSRRRASSPGGTSSSRSRRSACSRARCWRTSPRTPSSSAGSARRRRTARPRSTPRCSTPRSSRCPRPRRPSSASSPTPPTATSTSRLANEFARVADLHGIDVTEVIAAANSQPYSHIHQPGIGVGGHCIPVYPHLLLARAPGLRIVETARAGQRRPDGPGARAPSRRCSAAWTGSRCSCSASPTARASRSWRTAGRSR